MTRFLPAPGFEAEIARLTVFADAVDTAIARRQDTRGENFTMTADAGQHVKDILERKRPGRTTAPGRKARQSRRVPGQRNIH